jgi:uncharacterized protein with WD repeat
MKLCTDSDGNRTSIHVDGLKEFGWFPNRNMIAFTSDPAGDTVFPRISFLEFPSRRQVHTHTIKGSTDQKLYFHPQGHYLACMNEFLDKKTSKYSVELFDFKEYKGQIPHQQIQVDREVNQFLGVIWEPHHAKIAIHTKSKKILEAGQKQFSNDPYMTGVDIYQLKTDNFFGFVVKKVGRMGHEKMIEFYFAGSGNLLCTIEQETLTRSTLNFYMIRKISNEGQTTQAAQQGKKRTDKLITEKHLAAVEDTYDFIKIQRHEIKEKKWYCKWDKEGRYFVMQGRKTLNLDKTPKGIKFFNMFGEVLEMYNDIVGLDHVYFRPRPEDILSPDKAKKLKKEYKKIYEQMFKEEEQTEKKTNADLIKDQRKKIREDFLNNFFVPLRKEYESNIEKYKAIFPIKMADMAPEDIKVHNIYQFGEIINIRKLE